MRCRLATLLFLGLALLGAQPGGHSLSASGDRDRENGRDREHGRRGDDDNDDNALPFSMGYLITGNYIVGGVSLMPKGPTRGFLNGTIPMSGVPANADIVAAFLYWETVTSRMSQLKGAKFRGQEIHAAKASKASLDRHVASCFPASANTIWMMRADVLTSLPQQKDVNGNPTGKRLVNDADLRKYGYGAHTVTLPDGGPGNQAPQSAGATLVVVYRDSREPLTRIVFYDGVFVQERDEEMTQRIRGIWQSSTTNRVAKMTHLMGSGSSKNAARVEFNEVVVGTIPFDKNDRPDDDRPSSHRHWANPTFNVGSVPGWRDPGKGYGEEVTTEVERVNGSPYDCRSWAGIILSVTEQDRDADGLPDYVEDHSGVKDGDGTLLPDLHAMGASSGRKDLFVEVNAMWAPPGTAYGSADAPYDSAKGIIAKTDPNGHTHVPPPAVVKLVGDALKNAPVANPDGSTGITAHIDLGSVEAYHNPDPAHLKGAYSGDADQYLVPTAYARGGELIEEKRCRPTPTSPCQFPAYPGTVGWKLGYELYMLAPVGDNGEELNTADNKACRAKTKVPGICSTHRTRQDQPRNGLFHSLLYSHFRGKPKSPFPCLDAKGNPAAALDKKGTCAVKRNPEFYVASGSSGVSDLPGSKSLVSLGRWDNFVGTDNAVAFTTAHEIGHSLGLYHGGAPPTYAEVGTAPNVRASVAFEPNCKPNYVSVMSYLFQINGAYNNLLQPGVQQLVFSNEVDADVNEPPASDGIFGPNNGPMSYETAWYQRIVPPHSDGFSQVNGSLAYVLNPKVPADPNNPNSPLVVLGAKRHCDGSPLTADEEAARLAGRGMIRMAGPGVSTSIDWNGDGFLDAATSIDLTGSGHLEAAALDSNFDGSKTGAFHGFNDWTHLGLNQVGRGGADLTADHSGGDTVILDASGGDMPILDASGGTTLIVDASGGDTVILDASGGDTVILDASGGDTVILDASGGVELILDASGGVELILDASGGQDELDDQAADEILGPQPPTGLKACVIGGGGAPAEACSSGPDVPLHRNRIHWEKPNKNSDKVIRYDIYRATGEQPVTPASPVLQVGSTTPPTTTFDDTETLPAGQAVTYWAIAFYGGTAYSPPSNYQTVHAVNGAPEASTFSDTTNEDTPLAGNVLDHVTDGDNAHGDLQAILVSGPSAGHLVLNPNGSFTYTPPPDFESGQTLNGGTVTFTYKANDGTWRNGTPPPPTGTIDQLPYSNEATVTITVISRHTTTIISPSGNPSIFGDPVTFTATVTPYQPALGTPGNIAALHPAGANVTFMVDGVPTSVPLVNGQATYTTSALSAGDHVIQAVWCGSTSTLCDDIFYGSPSPIITQTIQLRPVTPSVTAGNKTYDGTDTAIVTSCSLSNVVAADVETVSCSAAGPNTFSDANAGTGKTVTATNISLGGSAAGNYQLTTTTASTTADISPRPVTPLVTAAGKTYNGTATATITGCSLSNVLEADIETVSCSAAGPNTFSDANAGPGKTVMATNISLGGGAAGNYTLMATTATTTADINQAASLTTVSCPSSVYYTGAAQTPCSATVSGVGGLSQSLPVSYTDNVNLGPLPTGTATYGGDVNHTASADSKTFKILFPFVATTSANCSQIESAPIESPQIAVNGNTVSMGVPGPDTSMPNCIHGASGLLPPLTEGKTKYEVTFAYKLFTWDSYNAPGTGGFADTGWWDSFSVSVSDAAYQNLSLTDPVTTANVPGLGFIWGGNRYADGILECNPNPGACSPENALATLTVTVPGSLEGSNYLNVVLDTKTQPQSNHAHPSYGLITILKIVQKP